MYTANRLQRWALTLRLYDFSIEYVQTEKSGNADVLSRLIYNHVKPEENYVIASVILEEENLKGSPKKSQKRSEIISEEARKNL